MDWLDVGTPTGAYTLESGVDGASFTLAQDSSYYISIRAFDNNGRISAVSTSAVFTTAPLLTLSSPTQFIDKLELTWTTPATPGITDYSIFFRVSGGGAFTLFADGVSTLTNTELTGLAIATTYDIYVTATTALQDVEYSQILTVATFSGVEPPTSLTLDGAQTSPSNNQNLSLIHI